MNSLHLNFISWRRKWQPTPVFLPGKSHGQRSQEGYSPWSHKRVRHNFIIIQLLSRIWLFVTPCTTAYQAPLSSTISWSFLKFMSIELVMLSNHLILCRLLLLLFFFFNFPMSFLQTLPVSQFFASGGQSIGVSVLASVFLMNIQSWFPLGLTGLISLQSKGLSRVFSSTTIWKNQFFGTQPSLGSSLHIRSWLL